MRYVPSQTHSLAPSDTPLVLGFLPGLLHAWYIISVTPDPAYEHLAQQDAERGNVTYYYVQTAGQPRYAPQQGGQRQYGTVNSTPNAQFPGAQQQGFVQPKAAPSQQPAQSQAGPSQEVPPTYAQAVSGDNKIQGP